MVEHFAAQGARVAFLDVDDAGAARLMELVKPCSATVPLFVRCDLSDIAAFRAAIVRSERELGPIRVLVNNASNDDRHNFTEITPDYSYDRMDANLLHHLLTSK